MTFRDHLRRDTSGTSYALVGRRLDPPLLLLSVLFVPVVLGPLLADLSPDANRAMELTGVAIWIAFVVEYVLLLALAPSRREFARTHKLDLLIVLVPFLRPFRLLRLLRLTSAASGAGKAWSIVGRIIGRPGFQPFFATAGVIVAAGAALTLAFEHEQEGSTIESFSDALWWAIVTSTTVGYGDRFPVTGGGQLMAVVLMLTGIAALGLLTASIAAVFVSEDDEVQDEDLHVRLSRIEDLLVDLRSAVRGDDYNGSADTTPSSPT